jgi:hypothetical protein
VDSRTQKNTDRTQGFILVQAIRALCPAANDLCIQEHPNRGLQQECKRFGRGSLSANPRLVGGEASSLSEGRKMVEWRSSRISSRGGSALGAELWVGVRTLSDWERSPQSSSISPSSSRFRPSPLYIEVGQVHGGLGSSVYSLHAP